MIDSKEGQADLARLSQSLNQTGSAVRRLDKSFSASATAIDAAVSKSIKALSKYAEVMALLDKMKTVSNPSQGIASMGAALASIRGPSPSTIRNIQTFMTVLSTLKPLPGAAQFARDLDLIAGAASRAGAALATLPRQVQTYGGAQNAAARASQNHSVQARNLGNSLSFLSGRFSVAYQAGTLFTSVFSIFTLGHLIKDVYETNNQMLKLEKATLFATGSFKESGKAIEEYIGIEQRLGLSIKDNIEYYGRFLIAAKASGMSLKETNATYTGVETALQVVGASAIQSSLALYGLTEMMQKGVVYSKEFNRQIGAQLPGNAVLGARALSNLRGHFVSVSDFFREMHKGTLMAPDFVPAWAAEVEKMYKPLLALAQNRPDVAITRLGNAFTVFMAKIGSGNFSRAIGRALEGITSKILETKDGITYKLKPAAEELANQFGRNLASAITTFGNALSWLMNHIDGVLVVVKAIALLETVKIFMSWGSGARLAAIEVWGLVRALTSLKGIQATVGWVTGRTAATRAAAAAANFIGPPTAMMAGAAGARILGSAMGPPTAAMAGVAASTVPAATLGTTLLAASAVALRFAGVVGVLILAFEALDYVFGSLKTGVKTDKGNEVTVHDYLMGPIDSVAEGLKGLAAAAGRAVQWFDRLFGSGNESNKNDKGKPGIFSTASTIVLEGLRTGLGLDAGRIIGANFTDMAKKHAEANPGITSLKQDDIDRKAIEKVLRQQEAAQTIEDAATQFTDAAAMFKGSSEEISDSDLFKQLRDSMNGKAVTFGGSNAEDIQAKVGGGQAGTSRYTINDILGIIVDAARKTGSDAGLYERMAFRESSYDPNAPNGGLFQLKHDTMYGTPGVKDSGFLNQHPEFEKQYGKYDEKNPMQNAIATMMLGQDDAAITFKKWGVVVQAMEAWVLHIMGAGTGGKFLAGEKLNPQEHSRDILGNEMFDKASKKNRWAFFAPDGREYTSQESYAAIVNRTKESLDPVYRQRVESVMKTHGYIPGGGAQTEEQRIAHDKEFDLARKQVLQIAAGADPATAALSQYKEAKIKLQDLMDRDLKQKMPIGPGAQSIFQGEEEMKNLERDVAHKYKLYQEAAGPIAHLSALQKEQNDIAQASIDGMAEEADWRAKVNELIHQGYTEETAKNKVAKEDYIQTQRNTTALNEQFNTIKKLNEAMVADRARSGLNPVEDAVNEMIARAAKEGETLEKARERLGLPDDKGVIPLQEMNKQAVIDANQRVKATDFENQGRISEAAANIGTSPEQRDLRALYKDTVGRMVNDTSSSLEVIEQKLRNQLAKTGGSFDEMTEKAKKTAKILYDLQNPPGLQRWADSIEPFAKKLEDIKADFMAGLSDTLTDQIVDGNGDWSGFAKRIQKEIVHAQVDDMLKGVLGAVGLVKRDGSSADAALYVIPVGSGTGGFGGGGVGSGSGGIFGGSEGRSYSNGGGGGILGTILGGGGGGGSSGGGLIDSILSSSGYGEANGGGDFVGTGLDLLSGGGGLGESFGGGDFVGTGLDLLGGGDGYTGGVESVISSAFRDSSGLGEAFGGGDFIGTGAGVMPFTKGSMGAGLMPKKEDGGGLFGTLLQGAGILGISGLLGDLFGSKEKKPEPSYHNPYGIIGEMSTNQVNGTQVAAHSNPIADILQMVSSIAIGSMFQGPSAAGGAGSGGFMHNLFNGGGGLGSSSNWLLNQFGGGQIAPNFSGPSGMGFSGMPRFAEGTHNTSGFPAMLHPNEAVIPLSRGRKVPIEMPDSQSQQSNTFNSNITIVTPNPDGFRKSKGSVAAEQNRMMRRNALRNLTN